MMYDYYPLIYVVVMSDQKLKYGDANEDMLDYLLKRRSVKAIHLGDPGPSRCQIETILSAGMRVPDHGMMCPWYFMVFEGQARAKIGEIIKKIYIVDNPHCPSEKTQIESDRFLRAPVVIAVISRIRRGKKPIWEQFLSAGAACQNILLAANASGFAAQWITEWYSYDARFKDAIGLDQYDHIAGFIHMGKAESAPSERKRPILDDFVTYWDGTHSMRKGETCDRQKQNYPDTGFDLEFLKRQKNNQ